MNPNKPIIPKISDEKLRNLAKNIKLLHRLRNMLLHLIIPDSQLKWLDFRHNIPNDAKPFNEALTEFKRVRLFSSVTEGKSGSLCVTLAQILAQIQTDPEINELYAIEVERRGLSLKNHGKHEFHEFTLIMYKKTNV